MTQVIMQVVVEAAKEAVMEVREAENQPTLQDQHQQCLK